MELLGAYIAEGSSSTPETTTSRLGASIACSDVAWLEKLRDDYNRLFSGAAASIVPSSPGMRELTYHTSGGELLTVSYADQTHKLQMMNSVSAVFFKALCGQRSRGKQLPDFIFHVPTEFKLLLLENMIKGDGSRIFGKAYSDEYRKSNFKYETKSLRLMSGLSTLLVQLGINHTVGYRPSKQTYSIATCTAHNSTKKAPRVEGEPYEGFVYDLSVDEFHTFVDACGSIVLKNTDSLFIENPDREKIGRVIGWAERDLGVELDIDKTYRYVAFSDRKKNYFGVLDDGTADIKGLTGKKSQTPEFLKKTFYEWLDILGTVYAPEDFERARSETKALLTKMVSKPEEQGDSARRSLPFNVMIGKAISGYSGTTPQHVRAAQPLQNSGKEIKAGDIISFVKTKTPPNVKPVSLARVDEVDVDKYLEYASSMFDQMLDSLGFSFDEIHGLDHPGRVLVLRGQILSRAGHPQATLSEPDRDLVGYGNRKFHFTWPGGRRLALSLVVNFEEGSEHSVPTDGVVEGIGEFLPVDMQACGTWGTRAPTSTARGRRLEAPRDLQEARGEGRPSSRPRMALRRTGPRPTRS